MNKEKLFVSAIAILIVGTISWFYFKQQSSLPIVAIANYGPHASLDAAIKGLKEELATQGFVEYKTISYTIADVSFDQALIPQTVTKLKNEHPKVMVVMSTPIAQYAKSKIIDIPLVYNVVTDPVDSGLIKEADHADGNMTGSSDMQDLGVLLSFVKLVLPKATTVGMMYSTADSNDMALLNMMRSAAASRGMTVVDVPVDQARDVPIRMLAFKDKVDFIYVGTSGPIQPTLPMIASEAQKMGIPIFNAEEQAVRDGLALASFGINYEAVGRNAGKIVANLLQGAPIAKLAPTYPTAQDHHGFINKKKAEELGITIPEGVTVVE